MSSLYPQGYVIWAGDAEPFPGPHNGKPANTISMNVTRVRTVGTEDITKVFDTATNSNTITYSSHLILTINFSLVSYSQEFPAYDQLRQLFLRLRRQSTGDQLNVLNMGYALHHDIVDVPYIADERELYCATGDVEFNALNIESDETADGGIIQTIGGWSGPVGASGDAALPGTLTQ